MVDSRGVERPPNEEEEHPNVGAVSIRNRMFTSTSGAFVRLLSRSPTASRRRQQPRMHLSYQRHRGSTVVGPLATLIISLGA